MSNISMFMQIGRKMSNRYVLRNSFVLIFSVFRKIKRCILGGKFGVRIPGSLFIYTTQECNLRCRGCISSGYHFQKTNEKIFAKALDEGRRLGVNSFIFLGGEPMTEESWKLILHYAERYPFYNFNIVTNGTLLDQKAAQELVHVPNVLLFVSVDGLKDNHNIRRGKGTFELITENLNYLRRFHVPFFTITTVTQLNYSEVLNQHFIRKFQFCGSLGHIFLPYLVNGCASDSEYELKPAQWNSMSKRIGILKKEIKEYFILDVFEMENRFAGCRAASRSLAISVEGSIQPCPALMFSMDNIMGKSLLESLRSPLLRFIMELKKENSSECLLIRNREKIEEFIWRYAKGIRNTSNNVESVLEYGFQMTGTDNNV